jgi:predicted RNA-binding Zn-ribbon protein involved in translation (DUF1610 family)
LNLFLFFLELIDKYGEGTAYEKECPECGYKCDFRTAGVHLGDEDSQSLRVYSQDDDFLCPKCGFADQGK